MSNSCNSREMAPACAPLKSGHEGRQALRHFRPYRHAHVSCHISSESLQRCLRQGRSTGWASSAPTSCGRPFASWTSSIHPSNGHGALQWAPRTGALRLRRRPAAPGLQQSAAAPRPVQCLSSLSGEARQGMWGKSYQLPPDRRCCSHRRQRQPLTLAPLPHPLIHCQLKYMHMLPNAAVSRLGPGQEDVAAGDPCRTPRRSRSGQPAACCAPGAAASCAGRLRRLPELCSSG